MPKNTKTRYQGVYARHMTGCAVETAKRCNCHPSYWGKRTTATPESHGTPRSWRLQPRRETAREDLVRDLRAGILPASESMRVKAAIEAFLRAVSDGVALNKQGRRYKPSAVRDLKGALENHVEPAFAQSASATSVDVMCSSWSTGSRRRCLEAEFAPSSTPCTLCIAGSGARTRLSRPAALVQLPAMDSVPRDRVAAPQELSRLLAALAASDVLPFAMAAYAGPGARRSVTPVSKISTSILPSCISAPTSAVVSRGLRSALYR